MLVLSWFISLVTAFFLIVIISYLYQIKRMKQFKSLNGPPVLPIIGNVWPFYWQFYSQNKNTNDIILDAFNNYGKIFQVYIGLFKQIVCVSDPKIAEKIMLSSKALDKTSLYDILRPWLGDCVITAGGEKWRKRRKLMNPLFHLPSYLEQYINTFNNFSKSLIEQLSKCKSDEEIDVYNLITLYALNIICDTAMGIKMDAQTENNSKYLRNIRRICISLFKRAVSVLEQPEFIFNYFTKNGNIHNQCLEILHTMTDQVIQERRTVLIEQLNQNNNIVMEKDELGKKKYNIVLDMLLQETINNEFLSDTDIREEVSALLFAGHDTVSYSASFLLLVLAKNPHIQNKLLQEVQEILGDDKNRLPTLSELNEMKYMDLVIKETMRLFPPVPFIGRKLSEKFELDGVSLPANTECMIFINGIHQDERYFPNPQQFIPERFLDPAVETAFMPFGAGQRKCLGYKYALYEMKSLISNLIRNFEFIQKNSDYIPERYLGIVAKPRGGVRIQVRSRN